jgi:glycosyltransferase involved in cell wall biosynthesis
MDKINYKMNQRNDLNDIEVAIPTYKRDFYLDKLLSTIPSHIKISVSDNGANVSSDLKSKFLNATFISHSSVIDIFENWNSAAKNATSKWLIIPSDDDLFNADAFEIIERYTLKYPDADVIIFGHNVIDEHDVIKPGWQFPKEQVFNQPLGYDVFKYGVDARLPAIVFKQKKMSELQFFDTEYKLTAGDSDLIQRVLLTGKAVFVPEIIGSYRIWGGNLTSQKIATRQWLTEIDYWQTKIKKIAKTQYNHVVAQPNFDMIADEVYAQNLLSGILNVKSKSGFLPAFSYLKSVRFPWKARAVTQLRIIKALIN